MADNKKIYTIQINGIQQSIDGVESLKKSLDSLDSRIKELQSAKVEVNTTVQEPKQTRTSNTAALSEEDKILKQIAQTEEKISAVRSENYQQLLAQKDLLKEATNDAKQRAVQERLIANTYSNTMEGLKQKLADIKNVIQTTDLGSDEFQNLTKEANNLNTKLKELEESYGQFGRNVGNYAEGVAEGMKNLTIQVGDSTKEFDNAKQALKELKKERDTLAVKKDMGLISEEEAKRLEELIPTVAQLQSAIQDAGKPMDALMDSMQSVVALAQTGKGFAAFFGIDDDEIERSIQKLVALQNAMQGIQTIQKQLQSQEGIGQWLVKGNESIDKLVNSIFGVEKASKAATVASKALGTALKAIGIGAIVAGVTTLISLLERWSNKQKKAAEEAEEAAEKVRKAVDDQRQAYISASAQYENTASRLSHLRSEYLTTNDALRKTSILKEASKEFKNLGMSVKSVTDAQNILVNQGDKVIELIRLQGDAAALAALRIEAFKKSFQMLMENGYDANSARILASNGGLVKALDEQLDKTNERLNKLKGELGVGVSDIGKGVSKSIEKTNKELTDLELRLMNEGLNKKLRQLDEEKRQTLNKIKRNSEDYLEVERRYQELRLKEINNFLKEMEKSIQESADRISAKSISLNIQGIKEDIKEAENLFDAEKEKITPISKTLFSSDDYQFMLKFFGTTEERLKHVKEKIEEINALKSNTQEIEIDGDVIKAEVHPIGGDELAKERMAELEKNYPAEIELIKNYSLIEQKTLKESFEKRYSDQQEYFGKYGESLDKHLADIAEKLRKEANYELEAANKSASGTYQTLKDSLEKKSDAIKDGMLAISNKYKGDLSKMSEADKDAYGKMQDDLVEVLAQLEDAWDNYTTEVENNEKKYSNTLTDIDNGMHDRLNSETEEYFNTQISNFRDFNSKMNNELSKTPTYDKLGFGIVNLSATKKQYKEIEDAAKQTITQILDEKENLNAAFENGWIDKKKYEATLKQLNDVQQSATDTLNSVGDNGKELAGKFIASINTYVQQFGQSLNQVLQSVWQYQDAEYEANIEQLDKFIEKWNDKMNEQEQIAEEHKNAMEAIEGELATARGDRRQQLIDNLNAEIEAQRQALAQKKKAEKEAQKLEKEKEEEALEQRKREHDRAVTQAIISANLAVANALATQPFWPVGVAMGILATTLGAVQIALIKSQHYANGGILGDGGVIQGKSHAQGGVKVLGGRAEVEGGEFITNKATTSKNVDLLEYINSKRKRINIDDLIEFYGGNSPIKKNIQTVRTKFADGGVVPTLRNDIELNDRLVTAMEDYSNRPVQVAVVDIMDRTQQVNEVKVMAGLSE